MMLDTLRAPSERRVREPPDYPLQSSGKPIFELREFRLPEGGLSGREDPPS